MNNRLNMFLMKLTAKLTPSCEVITHKISESYDRKLNFRERLAVRIHVMGCILCERYRRQMQALHNLLRTYASEMGDKFDSDIALPPESRKRIKEELQKAAHD